MRCMVFLLMVMKAAWYAKVQNDNYVARKCEYVHRTQHLRRQEQLDVCAGMGSWKIAHKWW